MSRAVFAQRYSPAGLILTEPWSATEGSSYYTHPREWFDCCTLCLTIVAHPDQQAAQRATQRTCPEPDCPPPLPAAPCAHCRIRRRRGPAYGGQLCDTCQRDPDVRVQYSARAIRKGARP